MFSILTEYDKDATPILFHVNWVIEYVLFYIDEQIKAASHNKSRRAINNEQQTNCYHLVHYWCVRSY